MRDPIFKVSELLIVWSHDKRKKSNICTYAIPMAIKFGRVLTYRWKTPHIKSRYLLIKWCCEKCKTLYLHFRNIYGHQTWQSGNLGWRDPNFKVMWPFYYVVTWQLKNISELPQYLWSPNLAKWVTYVWKIAHIKLHEVLITWSHGKYKILYLHFCSNYDQKFGQSSNLRRGNRISMSHMV